MIVHVFPKMRHVTRFVISFKKKGLNVAKVFFKKPILLPLWSESLEMWVLGDGKPIWLKLVYKDAAGRHYYIDFGKRRFTGWFRFSKRIPVRYAPNRPFSFRYKKLWLVKMLILDSIAGGRRRSVYHLANIGVSRIKRNRANYMENWKYKRILDFNTKTRKQLKFRFKGFKNRQISIGRYGKKFKARFSPDYLRISGDLKRYGFRRFRLKFAKPLISGICRKIIVSVKGSGNGETIYMLVKDVNKKYYLLNFGKILYTGWRKIYVDVPYWIIQKTKNIRVKKGLILLEFLVKPRKTINTRKVDLAFDNLAIVEDRGTFLYPGTKFKDPLLKFID